MKSISPTENKEFGLYSSFTEDFIPLKSIDINV